MAGRSFSRLPIHLEATITYNDTVIEGSLENISLKGVFVRTTQQIPEDGTVTITIYHHSMDRKICRMNARVIRSTPEGVALELEKTLLDCE